MHFNELVDLAWAAGLFEGEGSVYLDRASHNRGNGRLRLRLHLSSTDRDVLERFHRIVEAGSVRGPYWQKRSTKPIWDWSTSAGDEPERVAQLLMPYLGVRRRRQFSEALAERDESNRRYVPRPKGPRPGPRLISGQETLFGR